MKRLLTLVVAMVMVAGLSGAAVITTYPGNGNQAGWQGAAGSWTTFAFTGNFTSSPLVTTITPTVTGANGYAGIVANKWQDQLVTGTQAALPAGMFVSTTTFTWSGGPMTSIGGLWDTSPNNEGGGINIVLNLTGGGTATVVSGLTGINGFFGWISDTSFDSFTLSTNTNLSNFGIPYGVEHYTLDNLQVSTVPEPATLSMVGLALLGLGAFRRYRRQ